MTQGLLRRQLAERTMRAQAESAFTPAENMNEIRYMHVNWQERNMNDDEKEFRKRGNKDRRAARHQTKRGASALTAQVQLK